MTHKTMNAALAAAQADAKTLGMDSEGGKEGSTWKYASATGAIETLKPILLKHGLVVTITEVKVLPIMEIGVLSLNGEMRWEGDKDAVCVPIRFDMPIGKPNRGRDVTHAAQSSHTSAMGRLLRSVLLVPASNEAEVDTNPAATKRTSSKKVEPADPPAVKHPKKVDGAPDLQLAASFDATAKKLGVERDVLAMWGTRKDGEDGKKHAILGTYEAMITQGLLGPAVAVVAADLDKATAKKITPARFKKMVDKWADNQIPF